MKKYFSKTLLTLTASLFLLLGLNIQFSFAQNPYEIPFSPTDAGTTVITPDNPRHQHGIDEEVLSGETEDKYTSIKAIFGNIYFFIKFIAIALGVLYLCYAGFHMVTAGKEIEEVVSREKLNIKWTFYGLVALLLVDVLVSSIFGIGNIAGEVFQGINEARDERVYEQASKLTAEFIGISHFLMQIITGIAVLVIIMSSLFMIIASGNEDTTAKQKRVVFSVMLGLIIMRLGLPIVSTVLFGVSGFGGIDKSEVGYLVSATNGASEILGITNYVLGFVSIIAVLTIVYAAVRMVSSFGNEEIVSKSKSLLKNAVIGLVVAVSSYAIVATMINPAA